MSDSHHMSDKERFDALMQLSEFWMKRWQYRRQFEWMITLGLWGVLSASLIYIKVRPPEAVLIQLLIAIVFGYAFLWVRPLQVRLEKDARWYFYYKDLAAHTLDRHIPAPSLPQPSTWWERWIGFAFTYAAIFQILTTAGLAVCVFIFLGKVSGVK